MKTYKLEIFLDGQISYHEKVEHCSISEARQIISVLEELKTRFVITLMNMQKEIDIKNQIKS